MICQMCQADLPASAFYSHNRSRCRECQCAYQREWRRKNPAKVTAILRAYNRRIRHEVMSHYGGKCACCGEAQWEFLEMDHIGGGGNKHRAEIGVYGTSLHRWIKAHGFPDGFRVLCSNCNQAMGRFGYCPHQAKELTLAG